MQIFLGLWLALAGVPAWADTVELNPDQPGHYTVVPGDTLWDIASKFLRQPWEWRKIWHNNPQIENPHLIYPGDVIVLDHFNGQPRLQVGTPSELRLSPRVRSSPIEAAIPVIPMNAIRQFLTKPRVLDTNQLGSAPYVLSFADEHIVGGAGNRIFVRSIAGDNNEAYTIFRAGNAYHSPETGDILGYEALYVADTRLEQLGDPATLMITRSEQDVRVGDRLLPVENEVLPLNFQPHAPAIPIRGHIIGVLSGVSQIGQYSVVAIDKGIADGIESGHVLDIWQQLPAVRDIVGPFYGERVGLPEQKSGLLMVFRTFEHVSYALVMKATRFLHILDIVQTP